MAQVTISPNSNRIPAVKQIPAFSIYLHLLFFNRLWLGTKNYKYHPIDSTLAADTSDNTKLIQNDYWESALYLVFFLWC